VRRKADIHGTPSVMQPARPVSAKGSSIGSRIRVCVRKRPLSNKEIMRKVGLINRMRGDALKPLWSGRKRTSSPARAARGSW
jgi:hypothetical protein